MKEFLLQKSTIRGIILLVVGVIAIFEGLNPTTLINIILVAFGFEQIVIETE